MHFDIFFIFNYEFEKWILNDGFNYSNELKINITEDSTYVAVFTPSAYTLTFKHNGVVIDTSNIYVSTNLANIEYPQMLGYENVTWEAISFDTTNPSDVVINTLTADLINYTITFKDEDGSTIETINWNIEDKDFVAPQIPEKSGYDAAWEAYDLNVLENKEVKPEYSLKNYTLTFKNGDYVIKTQNITIETDLTAIQFPEMKGYTNVTWEAINFDKTNPSNIEVKTITANLVDYTLNYKINGEVVIIGSINVETDIANILKPTEFGGYENIVWGSIDFDKTNPANTEINAISADLINYTITFKAEDDSVIETIEWNAENKDFVVPQVPAKEGYTANWQTYNLNVYENKEIKPVYTVINYTITFKDEAGNVIQTSNWNIENKTVTEPAVPTKTGYIAAWEQYNFDTLQNINVGVQYSKGLTVKYLDENGVYDADDVDTYAPYTYITIVKTTRTEETPVSSYAVKVNVQGQGTITITFEQLIEHLNQYGYYDDMVVTKINDSADLNQGILNAYESASTELNVYYE